MKKIIVVLIFIFSAITSMAQTASVSQYLYKFSPLGEIIVRNLGMEDKNGNGVIDIAAGAGANEGYEGFIEKYGKADIGFIINGITQGANNGILEENEIVNYYYLNIRFKYPEETAIIDKEIKAYVYANNLPLVWLDNEKGTVMEAVTKVLGEGWNEKQVTEDEAVNMHNKALKGMKIYGRPGLPSKNGGYYTLPEFVLKKSGYCFEAAQFGFWFFSMLKINSNIVCADLTENILHDVIKLTNTGKIIDFFNGIAGYKVPANRWIIRNPIQSLGYYIGTLGIQQRNTNQEYNTDSLEQAVIYNKYDIADNAILISGLTKKEKYQDVIVLGEFIIKNINIADIMKTNQLGQIQIKHNLQAILLFLIKSYSLTKNPKEFSKIEAILKQYYGKDDYVNLYIDTYKNMLE